MVKLISATQGTGELVCIAAEGIVAYTARVSNPANQMNTESTSKLLKYLIKHKHWSPFEMADMTVEITTSRMISPQILRHWSFSYQEFSQRYAALDNSGVIIYAARRQDFKNKQNSIDDISPEIKAEWEKRQLDNWKSSFEHYSWALENQIAKECARTVLPLGTKTVMYMKGNIRDWIHYIQVRTDPSVQLEHRELAEACKKVFIKQFPDVAEALEWNNV